MKKADFIESSVTSSTDSQSGVGVVVIGRNEGERLHKCLVSIGVQVNNIVYVDSGSTDNSISLAQSMAIDVVALDMHIPFTAARARNAGFDRLIKFNSQLRYVQFVDGDCELRPNWIKIALEFLEHNSDICVVAGRLRERFPNATVYNMLCDIEWAAPSGETRMCGGVAMMRVQSFMRVKGFNSGLICGEEPELCSRLRAGGERIWRLEDEMGWHDANMTRFGQWWLRTVRSGFSDAQAIVVDGAPPARRGLLASQRAWFWGFIVPLISILLGYFWQTPALFLLLAYPLQIARLALRGKRTARVNWLHAFFLVVGKFPEVQGQIKYWRQYFNGQHEHIIEHK